MSPQDLAAIAAICSMVLAGVAALLRFMVLHYLQELKPNSGSSLRDAVSRLEENDLIMSTRIDRIYELLVSKGE
jgi:hypothetical protein